MMVGILLGSVSGCAQSDDGVLEDTELVDDNAALAEDVGDVDNPGTEACADADDAYLEADDGGPIPQASDCTTHAPPHDYFFLNSFFGCNNPCDRCRYHAAMWHTQYYTWCWQLSSLNVELWVKPKFE
jgi:hypothetical protein